MHMTSIVILALTAVLLAANLVKDRKKTAAPLRIAFNAAMRLLPSIAAIILAMGLIVGFIPPSWISRSIGSGSGALGVAIASLLGAVLFIPAIIAFPLAALLLKKGAKVFNIIIFLSACVCIKIPIEIVEFQFLGWKFAITHYLTTLVVLVFLGEIIGGVFFKEGYDAVKDVPAEEGA